MDTTVLQDPELQPLKIEINFAEILMACRVRPQRLPITLRFVYQ